MKVWVDSIGAELRAEHHVRIQRTPAAVYAFLADGLNNIAWRRGIRSIVLGRGLRGQTGARYEQILEGHGKRDVAGDYEITKCTPAHELRFTVVAGPFRPHGVFRLVPDGDDSTLVSFALEVEPRGRLRLRMHHLRRILAAEVLQLDGLKTVLEA